MLQKRVIEAELRGDLEELELLVDRGDELPPAVQESIAIGLGTMRPTPRARALAIRLAASTASQPRQLALRSLWKMGHPDATETFVRALEDSDRRIQLWGIFGLEEIGGPEAQAAILSAMTSPDAAVRRAVAKVLDADNEHFEKLTHDQNRRVRRIARRRLRAIRVEEHR